MPGIAHPGAVGYPDHFPAYPVAAENCVTLCDLGVFVDQAAKPVPPQNPNTRALHGWMPASAGRVLVQRPVLPMAVKVIGVFTEDQPEMPFVGNQHPVRALAIQRSAIGLPLIVNYTRSA